MIPTDQLSIDQATSTPEKCDSFNTIHENATPEVWTKQSTPTNNLDIKQRNPFLQDSKDTFIKYKRNTDDPDITPLFKKLPKNDLKFNLASIPLNSQESNITEPIQFKFNKTNRNIFNLSPKLQSLKSDQKDQKSSDISSAVKDAFNIFDKTNNNIPSTNSSMRSFTTTRKRKRTADPSVEIENFDNTATFKSRKSVTQNYLKTETLSRIISDPQCISNLTIIIQIILNSLIMLAFLSIGIVAFIAIKKDVDKKVATYVNEAIFKINSCKRDYFINNCVPEMRAPALENRCNEWATCMEQDPESVITSRAYFEVLADCLNAFFHNVSLKTLFSLGCLVVFCVIIPNILFAKFRTSTTINQNYYGQNDAKQETRNIKSQSSNKRHIKPNKALHRIEGSYSKTSSSRPDLSTNASVRFNPNVSYSSYECEDIKYDNNHEIGSILTVDSLEEEEDGESDIGNNRILLDF